MLVGQLTNFFRHRLILILYKMRMKNIIVMDPIQEMESQKWWSNVIDNGHIFQFYEGKMGTKRGFNVLFMLISQY